MGGSGREREEENKRPPPSKKRGGKSLGNKERVMEGKQMRTESS